MPSLSKVARISGLGVEISRHFLVPSY